MNQRINDNKIVTMIGLIFLAVGVIISSVGVVTYLNTKNFLEKAETASGVVVEVLRQTSRDSEGGTRIMYRPVIEFELPTGEVQSFVASTASNPPAYSIGDDVNVLYNPENLASAKIEGFIDLWFITLIFSIMGSVSALIGGGLMYGVHYAKKQKIWLHMHGTKIKAPIIGARADRNRKINGRHPWVIEATIADSKNGGSIIVKSPPLWDDPAPYLEKKGITEVTILVDKNNYMKHLMDVDFLNATR